MKKDILLIMVLTVITVLIIGRMSQFASLPVKADSTEDVDHEVSEIPEVKLEYGLPVDSFIVETGKVHRNQNLSNLLYPYGVTPKVIDKISKMKDDFDVRKIRSGHKYSLFFTKDSIKTLEYFVYEHTLTEFVVIKLTDSIQIIVDEKPVSIEKKLASGTIKTNLWDAMIENNINPMMSIELSEIYAWSIDFFGLKKGDQFYVIYDERFLDTVSAGINKIYAALFNHQNKDFYAIYFIQDSTPSYFDEEGGSLRRAFLKAPLKYKRISSRFTNSRMHPVLKYRRPHHGVDYAAPTGTPVHSVGDGFVIKKGYQRNGAGNYIKIKHNSVYTTQYAHLSRFAKGIKVGDAVKQGQVIGYVGMTGLATGPHLDFRFYKNGKPIDPLKVDAPPVEPIKKINREEFDRIKNEFIKQLNKQREEYLVSN